MAEIMHSERYKDCFPCPPPLKNGGGHDTGKYCAYHRETGHDTEACRVLRRLIEELIRGGKLKEFIVVNPSDSQHPGKELVPSSSALVPARIIHIDNYIPAIFGGTTEDSEPEPKRPRLEAEVQLALAGEESAPPVTFSFVDSNRDVDRILRPYNEAVIVTAFIASV